MVDFMTTLRPPGYTFPAVLDRQWQVYELEDGLDRYDASLGNRRTRLSPSRTLRQLRQLAHLVHTNGIDLLHFFGGPRTSVLAAAAQRLAGGVPTAVTLVKHDPYHRRLTTAALKRLDAVHVATEHAASELAIAGIRTELIRYGPVKRLVVENRLTKRRVLFWRDASFTNGADTCRDAFSRVCRLYPEVSFDFAVRPYFDEVDGLDDLAAANRNVHVHRFPYTGGPTLAQMMEEAIAVVLPFRETSIDPQFAVLESMAAGVPVISTRVASIPELITPGWDGWLIQPGDSHALSSAIEHAVKDPVNAAQFGARARLTIATKWNWNSYAARTLKSYERAIKGG